MSDPDSASNLLRVFLTTRDAPCPGCGYNLRGLTSGSCPECNQPLQLTVTLQDSHVGALLATIIPISAVAGAAILVIASTLLISVRAGLPPRPLFFALVCIPAGIVLVFGPLSLWLALPRGRAWFRQRTRPARKSLLIWSWGATGLCFVGYATYWILLVF